MSSNAKLPRDVVLPVAQHIVEALAPCCRRIEIAGSLRRERPEVGDIEIVAIPLPHLNLFREPAIGQTPLDDFLSRNRVQLTKDGERYKQFAYGRYQVDLFLPTAETWGSILAIRTGSWEFSRWLVTSEVAGGAAAFGVNFQSGRVYVQGRPLLTPEEPDVFAAIGLAYIEPRDRFGPVENPVRVQPVWNYDLS